MKRRGLLAAAAALAAAPGVQAQSAAGFDAADISAAERLRDAAMADTHAWRLLRELCTQVGARSAGSPGDAKAMAWAQVALKDLALAKVRAEPIPIRAWVRGPASAKLITPSAQDLVIAALGNSVAAPADGIEAEVA